MVTGEILLKEVLDFTVQPTAITQNYVRKCTFNTNISWIKTEANHIWRCSTPTSAWLSVCRSRQALLSLLCLDLWSVAAGDQSCPGAPGAAASGSLQVHPAFPPWRTELRLEKLSSYLWDLKAGFCSSLWQQRTEGRHKRQQICYRFKVLFTFFCRCHLLLCAACLKLNSKSAFRCDKVQPRKSTSTFNSGLFFTAHAKVIAAVAGF